MTGGGSHGAGSKRPARTDASALFKRGGPKAMRPAHRPGDAAGRAGRGGPDETGDERRDDEWGCATTTTTTTTTGGRGEVEPSRDGSLASHPRLAAKLRALCSALERPAGAHQNNLSVARWTATGDARLPFVAELLRTRGKHFTKFGHVCGAKTYLLPEEVLFLVETERLAVVPPGRARKTNDEKTNDEKTNDVPAAGAMSLRAVRDAVTRRCGVREAWYAVFAKLAREGYTVRRFDSPWCQPRGASAGDHAAFAGSGPLAGAFATLDPSRAKLETPPPPPPREEEEPTVENIRKEDEPTAVPAANRWWVDASTWTGAETEEPIVPEPECPAPFQLRLPVFQVYAPNRHFSKRTPDDVSFFVFHADVPPTADEVQAAAEAVANGFREGRGRDSSHHARREDADAAPDAVPAREKMVYAHVSDSTVMMYRMDVPASRAPKSDEVPQSL